VPLNWEDWACRESCPHPAEGTFQMKATAPLDVRQGQGQLAALGVMPTVGTLGAFCEAVVCLGAPV